jgi:hypothetical protein
MIHLSEVLRNPAFFPDKPQEVKIVQTHASYLVLTDHFVYKIKKSVDLGFLDYTTLEKRKHFIELEFALNGRLCSNIYLEILPIYKRDETLSFEEPGEIVEYALKMVRMNDNDFFINRLNNGRIMQDDMREIAEKLAVFYQNEGTTDEISQWGHVEKIRISTDQNFRQSLMDIGETLSEEQYSLIRIYTETFLSDRASLFEKRITEGWIRNCHGDLHLDHFHYHNGAWCIYDCIEFNDSFRYIDVASDIAFLTMDLDYNGRPDLVAIFLKEFDRMVPDPDRANLETFYRCYRAVVRGKVESMISRDSGLSPDEAALAAGRARRYYSLSLRYAVLNTIPCVYIFMGLIASGKSGLAKRLASETGVPIFRSDVIRKDLAGLPLYERPDTDIRNRLYKSDMTKRVYDFLEESAIAVIQSGSSVVIDCTYSKSIHRKALTGRLESESIPYLFIEVWAPESVLKERLLKREMKKDIVSDARLEDYDTITASYEPPIEIDGLIRLETTGSKSESFMQLGKMLMKRKFEVQAIY